MAVLTMTSPATISPRSWQTLVASAVATLNSPFDAELLGGKRGIDDQPAVWAQSLKYIRVFKQCMVEYYNDIGVLNL